MEIKQTPEDCPEHRQQVVMCHLGQQDWVRAAYDASLDRFGHGKFYAGDETFSGVIYWLPLPSHDDLFDFIEAQDKIERDAKNKDLEADCECRAVSTLHSQMNQTSSNVLQIEELRGDLGMSI